MRTRWNSWSLFGIIIEFVMALRERDPKENGPNFRMVF
jgi:hypothetical protein